MNATTRNATTTQVFRVFINATPEAVWDAITSPEWTARYGYLTPAHYELRPGGTYRALATDEMRQYGVGEVAVDGEVLECDPPRRLVQTWKARFGVRKHLKVLEDAGLVVARKQGREKLHFLNPVPIRLIHDRWVSKYAEPWASALTELKTQLEDNS